MKTMITYAEALYQAIYSTQCNDFYINEAIDKLVEMLRKADKVFLIGNGGSGACCDHMANDLCLAGVRAQALTNTNNITCAANDFGFENIFAKQLEWLSQPADDTLLIAFSCSGNSENILRATAFASKHDMQIVTFSGKQPTNALRDAGHLNFYVPSQSYGVVQLAHEALIHCAIDKIAGLT